MGSSKKKVQVWKRALLHFFLCFIVGVLTGLTPFSTAMFSTNLAYNYRPKARQDFAFELKNIPTNARQDFSQVGNRGRLIETIKIEVAESNSEKSLGLEDPETEKNSSHSLESIPRGNLSSVRLLGFAPRKLVIAVTPSHNHPFQALYLNRLAHTLRLVPPPLLWIVVEMQAQSMETAGILRKTGVMYRHLVCEKNETDVKDRNTHLRNVALAHIEQHQLEGIVFFADSSNVYTLELFEQLRKIRHFGTWPVGILTHNKNKVILQGPVCNSTKVIGWHTDEKSKGLCRFHAGMSGFAFNSTLLWDPQRWGRPTLEPVRQLDVGKDGFQESTFIEQVVEDESQMEGMPNGCSRVMVWNLHLEASRLVYPSGWIVEKNLDANVPLKQYE